MTLLIILVFILGIAFGMAMASRKKKAGDSEFFDVDAEWRDWNPDSKIPTGGIIFHGGCHGCSMQQKKGLHYCTGCQYFEADWSLPDLNDEHARREARMQKIRLKAKIDSRKN